MCVFVCACVYAYARSWYMHTYDHDTCTYMLAVCRPADINVHKCVYMYIYINVNAYVHVCLHICMYVCAFVCMHVCMRI